MKKTLLYCLFLLSFKTVAQSKKISPTSAEGLATHFVGLNATFGIHAPSQDMAQRFGSDLHFGGSLERISLSKGWIIGADFFYFFGKDVKEDVLKPLRTAEGNILGDIGTYADVVLRERGLYCGIHGGKLFKLKDDGNRISGIRLTLSAGFLQHKIRIQDNSNSAPHLQPPYTEGYDRLTNGIGFSQFIGYQTISRDKTLNFFIGLDCIQGFTQNRRRFNFDTRQIDDKKRLDILYGVRVGWFIPLFSNQNADNIEY